MRIWGLGVQGVWVLSLQDPGFEDLGGVAKLGLDLPIGLEWLG